jgi:hypothetical protein
MKQITGFTIFLAVFLAACAPIIPGSNNGGSSESSPIAITSVVRTVVASTVGPAGTLAPFPTPEPLTPIPTIPSAKLSPTELKYKVLDQYPDFFFCDPDLYPIAVGDSSALALQRFPQIQSNQEEFQAILNHNGLSGSTSFPDAQKLLIYGDYKRLNALYFELVGEKYQFQIQTGSEGQQGYVVKGTIDGNGSIDVQERTPGYPRCPICLAIGTLIDTPQGAVTVENLHIGDTVWTVNGAGERVIGRILKVGSVRVPLTHEMIHVRLSDGRELWASPGHPTTDGRNLGTLKTGESLDGAQIILIERVPYKGAATYDLLPSGTTGYYWANGILMGSTLKMP